MPKSLFVQEHAPNLAELIDQGSRLWHEEARRRSGKTLTRLWNVAGARISAKAAPSVVPSLHTQGTPRDQHSCFSAWDAQLLIFGGSLVPADWNGCDSGEPYPHQGLFASAFFFHEAKKLFGEKDANAAWASLTQAYHCLEMNAPVLTASESGRMAASIRHARNKKELLAIIVQILSDLREDKSLRSGAKATERVVQVIERNPEFRRVLYEYDSRTKKKDGNGNSTPGDRLERRINKVWSTPKGRCLDIMKALAPFKQKRCARN